MNLLILGLVFILGFGVQAHAQRVVNTLEEKVRLEGWGDHQRQKKQFDRERMAAEGEIEREEKSWQRLKREDLAEYRKEKARLKRQHDDSGVEYLKDQARKKKEEETFRAQLEQFLEIRRKVRNQSRSTVKLTEEEELGLIEDRERFDWDKRNLLDSKGAGGKKTSSPSRGSILPPIPQEFVPPPPPPPPTPDFELDVPPPPPPPPMPEFSDGNFGGEIPPPPPPGGFEDQVPPPLFEEDF